MEARELGDLVSLTLHAVRTQLKDLPNLALQAEGWVSESELP